MNPKNGTFESLLQATDALAVVNDIELELAKIDLAEAKAIQKVRNEFANKRIDANYDELEAKRETLLTALQNFSVDDRKSWDGQSQSTSFGTFGFRWGNRKVEILKKVVVDEENLVEQLKESRPEFVQTIDSLDKSSVLDSFNKQYISKDDLVELGIDIVQEEKFYVKTEASKALDTARKQLRDA